MVFERSSRATSDGSANSRFNGQCTSTKWLEDFRDKAISRSHFHDNVIYFIESNG